MTPPPLNPYRAPRLVPLLDEDESVAQTGRRHHLSNRVMAYVIGTPGLLFLAFAVAAWAEMLGNLNVPRGKEYSYFIAVFLLGIVVPTLGMAMVTVAAILWRYDSQDS